MAIRRAFYDVQLDGGGPGPILMRGAQLRDGEAYLLTALFLLEDIVSPGGVTISFGWGTSPSGLLPAQNADFMNGAPLQWNAQFPAGSGLHYGMLEPIIVTVTGGTLTDGMLELVLLGFLA